MRRIEGELDSREASVAGDSVAEQAPVDAAAEEPSVAADSGEKPLEGLVADVSPSAPSPPTVLPLTSPLLEEAAIAGSPSPADDVSGEEPVAQVEGFIVPDITAPSDKPVPTPVAEEDATSDHESVVSVQDSPLVAASDAGSSASSTTRRGRKAYVEDVSEEDFTLV